MQKAWLYCLDLPYTIAHPLLKDIEFSNEWVVISRGQMKISRNYAWDGCTPRYHVFGLVSFGTPNGILRHGKPWTYWASLAHDVLCQFRDLIKISKCSVLQVFNDVLERDKWPLRRLYVRAVDKFGPQDFLID